MGRGRARVTAIRKRAFNARARNVLEIATFVSLCGNRATCALVTLSREAYPFKNTLRLTVSTPAYYSLPSHPRIRGPQAGACQCTALNRLQEGCKCEESEMYPAIRSPNSGDRLYWLMLLHLFDTDPRDCFLISLGKRSVSIFLILLARFNDNSVLLLQAHKHSWVLKEHLINLLE